jgi:hypothetical protein
LRARASGELAEYREKAASRVPIEESDRVWFKWLKNKFTEAAIARMKE